MVQQSLSIQASKKELKWSSTSMRLSSISVTNLVIIIVGLRVRSLPILSWSVLQRVDKSVITWSTVGMAIIIRKWLGADRLPGGFALWTWCQTVQRGLNFSSGTLVSLVVLRVDGIPYQAVSLKHIYFAALKLFGNGPQRGKDIINNKFNNEGRVSQIFQKNPCSSFRIGWGFMPWLLLTGEILFKIQFFRPTFKIFLIMVLLWRIKLLLTMSRPSHVWGGGGGSISEETILKAFWRRKVREGVKKYTI